jgi:hypothetical protein
MQVTDNEGVQGKALNHLAFNCNLRVFHDVEDFHPRWNAVKRAIKAAGMFPTQLKATVQANWEHGPWLGGNNLAANCLQLM